MTTFSMIAPVPGQRIAAKGGTVYTADGFGLITGVVVADVDSLSRSGCDLLGPGTLNDAAAWNYNNTTISVVAAAGSTQLGATVTPGNIVRVTCTTSSEGVSAKLVATGAATDFDIPGTKGFKLYPPANCTLDALSTNTGVAIVAGKGVRIRQRDATHFDTVLKGA